MPRRAGGLFTRPFLLLTTTAIATLLAGAPTSATPARQFALGSGDYLEDASAVFRWPGSARDDAGRWWLDSGRLFSPDAWSAPDSRQDTGPATALTWTPGGPGSPWTAGVAAHLFSADADHAGLHRDGPGSSLSLLAGRRVGGVDVAATWRTTSGALLLVGEDTEETEFRHRRDDVGLGARFDLSSRAYLDVAGDMRRERDRRLARRAPNVMSGEEPLVAHAWSARARAFISVQEHIVLTPALEIVDESIDGGLMPDTWWVSDPEAHHDNRLLRFGAALCWLPDPDRLLAVSYERLDLDRRFVLVAAPPGSAATEDDRATDSLRLAAEQRVNWWLSLRASLAWTRVTFDDDRAADPHLDVAGGAALHLGAWGLDVSAGSAPLPEPRRWLAFDPGADLVLRASLHHDF